MAAPMVLLGVLDEPIRDQADSLSLLTNKVGGKKGCAPLPTSPEILTCSTCSGQLSLVVQVYCPLDGSPYHRALYLFACCKKQCWNKPQSWLAVRMQVLCEDQASQLEVEETEAEMVSMATTDWCDAADDWGDEDEDAVDMATLTTTRKDNMTSVPEDPASLEQFQNLKISASAEQTEFMIENNSRANEDHSEDGTDDIEKMENVLVEDFPVKDRKTSTLSELLRLDVDTEKQFEGEVVFEAYYISVFEEPDSSSVLEADDHVQRLMSDYQQKEGVDLAAMEDSVASTGKRGGGESYEKVTARHGDRMFQKFAKRVALCPEQILRYSRNGKPLYIQEPEKDQVMTPLCSHCGGPRVFELQLMPSMVSMLKTPGAGSHDPVLEFGTVLVYTCAASCWTDQRVSCMEHVVVQADPYSHFFTQT